MKGSNPERLIKAYLRDATPYKYVSPLEALSQGAGIPAGEIIKLDGNENPYGCSPRVYQALSAHPYLHIYPDSEQQELRKALAPYAGVPPGRLVMGAGSDELIDLIMRLFVEPGDGVVNCTPTFGMYSFSTGTWGARLVEVPRDEGFAIDVDRTRKAIQEEAAKLIFIASPNNPTGNMTPVADIIELLDTGVLLVLDEAYCEFSGETMTELTGSYDNLIILRTFSKWAGLAGLRVGYGIFPESIVPHLMRIKPPYNINVAAQVAAMASLQDLDYLQRTVKAIVDERQRLFSKLDEIGCFQPYPSRANFILCRVSGNQAEDIYLELKRRGISIRYFDTPRLSDCLRFSVGKPEHTDRLIAALTEIC